MAFITTTLRNIQQRYREQPLISRGTGRANRAFANSKVCRRLVVFCVAVFSVLSLASCSFFPANTSESIRLEDLETASAGGPTLRLIQKSPFIYKLEEDSTTGAPELFATAIKDCAARKRISSAALSRQLLVGLKEIHIKKREEFDVDGVSVHYSLMSASLDEVPVRIAAYTMAQESCVVDYVMWSFKQGEETSLSLEEELILREQKIFEGLVKKSGSSSSLN